MDRKRLVKKRLQNMLKCVTMEEKYETELLSWQNQEHSMSSKIHFVICFMSLAICVCLFAVHTGQRISYYLISPKVVDVFVEAPKLDDFPALTLCGTQFRAFLHHIVESNIEGAIWKFDKMWKLSNTTAYIQNAYFENELLNYTVNASLENVNTISGICANIFFLKPVYVGSVSDIRIMFRKQDFPFATLFVKPNGTRVVSREMKTFVRSLEFRVDKITITMEKYNLLSTTRQPCGSVENFDACHLELKQNTLSRWFSDCKFPFMTKNQTLPDCKLTTKRAKSLYIFGEGSDSLSSARLDCKCKCTQKSYFTTADRTSIRGRELRLSMHSDYIRVMTERFAYDMISLLCDIGGNLGLYLGLSGLSLAEIIFQCVNLLNYKRKLFVMSKDSMNSDIVKKLKTEVRNSIRTSPTTKEISTLNERKTRIFGMWNFKIIKILLLVICFYQTYDRVMHYLNYPTTHSIELKDTEGEVSPSTVICFSTNNLQRVKKSVARERKNSVARERKNSVDSVNFVDIFLNSKFSIETELWTTALIASEKTHSGKNNGTFLTNFENCGQLSPRRSVTILNSRNDCNYVSIVIPPQHSFDLKKQFTFNCRYLNIVKYKPQRLIRLNTSTNPCTSRYMTNDCIKDCYSSKLAGKNLSCSLPFMKIPNLLPCNSSITTKEVRGKYLETFLSTDPFRECSCKSPCDETLHTYTHVTTQLIGDGSYISYAQQTQFLEILREQLSFPIEKLFCDIGSNLGILTGISLIEIFQLLIKSKIMLTKYSSTK